MKTEKTLVSIFIIALILKFCDIPGHSILLILSIGIIALLYFPASFYFFSDKTIKSQNTALSIIGGFVLSIATVGVLFKLMYWPGATTQLLAAMFLLPILLIVTILFSRKNNEELNVYYKNYLTRIIFWFALVIICFFTSNVTLLNIQHYDDPEMARLKIKAYSTYGTFEDHEALKNYQWKKDSLRMANH